MLSLKIFFKLIPYLWPFLKEMFLGNKPLLVALRDNKKKLFFITLIIFSFGLNFVTVPRLVSMSMQYIALDKRYKELENRYNIINSSTKHPKANGAEQQIQIKEPTVPETKPQSTSTKPPKKKASSNVVVAHPQHVDEIRDDFLKRKKLEEENARLNY